MHILWLNKSPKRNIKKSNQKHPNKMETQNTKEESKIGKTEGNITETTEKTGLFVQQGLLGSEIWVKTIKKIREDKVKHTQATKENMIHMIKDYRNEQRGKH